MAPRKMTVAERKLMLKHYGQYRKLGLSKKDAFRWAYRIALLAKDHWAPPKCGW